jgi:muramoyltetrapeptide carboxypeptidase
MYATLNESIAFAVSGYGFPVCFNFPVGHVRENFPLLMGKEAKFIVEENSLIFKQN